MKELSEMTRVELERELRFLRRFIQRRTKGARAMGSGSLKDPPPLSADQARQTDPDQDELKKLLRRHGFGEFKSLEEGERQTRAMIERKRRLLSHTKISRVLAGELETTALNAKEKAIWAKRFLAEMSEPGPTEEAFFTELCKNHEAVGLDASDTPDMEARAEATRENVEAISKRGSLIETNGAPLVNRKILKDD
jgi:hypothetical protein